MIISNNKIELTEEEKDNFKRQLKKGILYQLHKEKLLTNEQLKQVINSLEN
ncbi:hypothetical protein [Acetivibrio cellulolyticus]|uniref:hypothetical protein n=1 Tax=Acetivibrio cellulolyticus TaxID=35830 RepID=UPI0001E2CBF3|nr:hypothetical protein [Acetivibrio cellulolyticus]